MRKSI